MAACDGCGTTILFGGVKRDDMKFCNEACYNNHLVVAVSGELPQEEVDDHILAVHQGTCPVCNGQGPCDVHDAHYVTSMLIVTKWKSISAISCRSCAKKRQAGAFAWTALLGLWGFPWGIILTPIYLVKNITSIFGGPKPDQPSAKLEWAVRTNLAEQIENSRYRKS